MADSQRSVEPTVPMDCASPLFGGFVDQQLVFEAFELGHSLIKLVRRDEDLFVRSALCPPPLRDLMDTISRQVWVVRMHVLIG